VSIEVMRLLQVASHRDLIYRIDLKVHEEVASYLLNRKRAAVAALEAAGEGKQFIIHGKAGVAPEFLEFVCYDNNDNEVKFLQSEEPPPRPSRRR